MRGLVRPSEKNLGARKGAGAKLRSLLFALMLCGLAAGAAAPRPAWSCTSGSCPNCAEDAIFTGVIIAAFDTAANETMDHINEQFDDLRDDFWVGYFWREHVLAAMQNMAQTLTTAAMMQQANIGAFLDASEQLQRQRLMQQKGAEAHKDYQSAMTMCSIGTLAKGLGAAYREGQVNATVMARRSIDRQMQAVSVAATNGSIFDLNSRVLLFKRRHCDIHDNNDGLTPMCGTSAPPRDADKDINITRTIYQPGALEVDFAPTMPGPAQNLTRDEEDVLALDNMLFAHETIGPIPASLLERTGNNDIALDVRSVVAKRAVAENSYHALVGMKSTDPGGGPGKFMSRVLEVFGVARSSAKTIMGNVDKISPSYDSEMDFLTKRLEQDPVFYTNLYDTPANNARKGAALRAIGLIQHMDMFKSRLRNEMILAEIVELDVARLQQQVQDAMDRLRKTNVR